MERVSKGRQRTRPVARRETAAVERRRRRLRETGGPAAADSEWEPKGKHLEMREEAAS